RYLGQSHRQRHPSQRQDPTTLQRRSRRPVARFRQLWDSGFGQGGDGRAYGPAVDLAARPRASVTPRLAHKRLSLRSEAMSRPGPLLPPCWLSKSVTEIPTEQRQCLLDDAWNSEKVPRPYTELRVAGVLHRLCLEMLRLHTEIIPRDIRPAAACRREN